MYTFRNAVVRFPEKARSPDNWDQGTGAVFGEASLKGRNAAQTPERTPATSLAKPGLSLLP